MGDRTTIIAAALAIGLAFAGAALAQPSPRVITNPDWLRKPSGDDVGRYYPELAQKLEIEGRASISCTVTGEGDLSGCRVVAEAPLDLGFGAAAMKLSALFRMRPKTVNGAPVDGGTVRIPILFRLPAGDEGPEAAMPQAPSAAALQLGRRVTDAFGFAAYDLAKHEEDARELEFTTQGTESERFAAADAMRSVVRAYEPALRDAYAAALASVFSEKELAGIAAHFEGPAGRATRREDGNLDAVRNQLEREAYRRTFAEAHRAFCTGRDCDWRRAMARIFSAEEATEGGIDAPEWSVAPTDAEIGAAQPFIGHRLGLTGIVRMTCKPNAMGWLEACRVREAWPSGLGYDAAALKLAGRFRVSSRQLGQGAAGEALTVRILFPPLPEPDPYDPPTARSAAGLAAARDLRQLMGGGPRTRAEIDLSLGELRAGLGAGGDPKVVDAGVAALADAEERAGRWFEEQMAHALAAAFTEAELNGIIAFRRSAFGQAFSDKGAALDKAISAALKPVEARITTETRARYCASRPCAASAAQTANSPPASARKP